MTERLIPKHGGYRKLKSIQVAQLVIAVACALLDRQLSYLARAFETQGGFPERLYQTRRNRRGY